MLEAQNIAHLIEQFFCLALARRSGHAGIHQSVSKGRQLGRQANYTELLRLILRKNSIYFSLGS
jgi:hypothetical protein